MPRLQNLVFKGPLDRARGIGTDRSRVAKAIRILVEYYSTSIPCLPLHIRVPGEEMDLITYVDADLFFLADPLQFLSG